MNIFKLDRNAKKAAEYHCDKHVVKMLIEYAQLMSTAHRVLDGKEWYDKTANNRKIKRWLHPSLDSQLYLASHVNHPSGIWTRQSTDHYNWLYDLWENLHDEYTKRYNKVHLTFKKLSNILEQTPANMPVAGWTDPPPAMPDHCKKPDIVDSYRTYYKVEKATFATWKTQTPHWW